MPTPIDDLEREHSMVRGALRVLERIAAHVEAGLPFPSGDMAVLLRFFREFVEAVHHRKEAECLYPAAVMAGGEPAAECAGLLLRAHDDTRALLHALVLFWEPAGDLLESERRVFAETCRTYAIRLQRHMQTEEEKLFRGLRIALPPDDRLALASDFSALEGKLTGAPAWRRELRRLDRIWLA